jgi:succinyl-CoA synthetase beta subunit
VKAQIHAGGARQGGRRQGREERDEARHVATGSREDARHAPDGAAGRVVRRLFVEQGCTIARELYLGIVVDRDGSAYDQASTEGGRRDRGGRGARMPEKIFREAIDPVVGFAPIRRGDSLRPRARRKELVSEGRRFWTAVTRAFATRTRRWSRSIRSW